jgi:hypothetical protein
MRFMIYMTLDILMDKTVPVVQLSEFLATDAGVLGSIPGATRFPEGWWVWNGVHPAS